MLARDRVLVSTHVACRFLQIGFGVWRAVLLMKMDKGRVGNHTEHVAVVITYRMPQSQDYLSRKYSGRKYKGCPKLVVEDSGKHYTKHWLGKSPV